MKYNKTPRLCKLLVLNALSHGDPPKGIDFTLEYVQSHVDKTREFRDVGERYSSSKKTYTKIFKLRHEIFKKEFVKHE